MSLFLMRRETQPLLKHIFQVSEEGEEDDQWIEKIDAGECIVITGDQGNKEPRLPAICKAKRITHIILAPSVHHSTKFERARAIVMLWPQILKTFDAVPGSRFHMKKAGNSYAMVVKGTRGRRRRRRKG